jgi:hypothetical protein
MGSKAGIVNEGKERRVGFSCRFPEAQVKAATRWFTTCESRWHWAPSSSTTCLYIEAILAEWSLAQKTLSFWWTIFRVLGRRLVLHGKFLRPCLLEGPESFFCWLLLPKLHCARSQGRLRWFPRVGSHSDRGTTYSIASASSSPEKKKKPFCVTAKGRAQPYLKAMEILGSCWSWLIGRQIIPFRFCKKAISAGMPYFPVTIENGPSNKTSHVVYIFILPAQMLKLPCRSGLGRNCVVAWPT